MEYLFYYIPPTPNKIWEDKTNKKQQKVGQNTSFFYKNWKAGEKSLGLR